MPNCWGRADSPGAFREVHCSRRGARRAFRADSEMRAALDRTAQGEKQRRHHDDQEFIRSHEMGQQPFTMPRAVDEMSEFSLLVGGVVPHIVALTRALDGNHGK